MGQDKTEKHFKQEELEEFELINLCHCHEYLQIRDYDYVAWKSEKARKDYIKKIENLVFSRYRSWRLFENYYQKKYDSTLFFKQGISIHFEKNFNFSRLDSLYYEPLVQHYVKMASKTENLPYLGLDGMNFFFDCFHRVKEMPLEKELELFMIANPKKVSE